MLCFTISLVEAETTQSDTLKEQQMADTDAVRGEKKDSKIPSSDDSVAGKENSGKDAVESGKDLDAAKKTIVAKVNGSGISMFSLIRFMNRIAPKYVGEGEAMDPETTAKIRGDAMDGLIYEELAVQEAINQGINPSADDIDKVVVQIKQNLGSEEAYKEYLSKNGLTDDGLKGLIERSRRFELITAGEIYGKVEVEENLLREEYEKEKSRYVLPDYYVVEDVYFLKSDDEQDTAKKAEEVLNEIREHNGDVWKLVLDGTFIVRKIRITRERYSEIYEEMDDMKAGDLSGIINEKDGFHIIKVVKKELSRQATFEETRVTLESRFLVSAQEKRRREWEEKLRRNARIEISPDYSRKEPD